MTNNKKIICVVGPTASGKTGLGVKLAKKFDGEIISADSRQVYRGLNIGTGKEGSPSKAQEFSISNFQFPNKSQLSKSQIQNIISGIRWIENVPQWMIDVCEPGEKFTLFDWLKLTKIVLDDIWNRGKLPIIVGGTGLYVQALIEGFQLMPENDKLQITNDRKNVKTLGQRPISLWLKKSKRQKICNYTRGELEKKSLKELQEIYSNLEIESWKLKVDVHNPHRLIRAIERAQSGEKPTKIKPDFEALQIGIKIPRDELYQRIDQRVDERFEEGMLEEVENLIKNGVNIEWLLSLGLEYKIIGSYIISSKFKVKNSKSSLKLKINNKNLKVIDYSSYSEMTQDLKYKIHQFARRQLTWFRKFPQIKWVDDCVSAEKEVKFFLGTNPKT